MARFSSWLAAVFFIAYLVLGYFYLKQRAEMALVRAEASEATAREQQGRRQVDDFRQKLAAASDAAKKAEEELAAQDRAATARAQAAPAGRTRTVSIGDIIRDHPEYAELQRKQMRRLVLRQYGDALAGLGLPPDQLVQLKDLLAGRAFFAGDPRLAGLDPGTPAYMQAMRTASEDINRQIEALIGPEGQRKLQDGQMIASAKNQIANTYAPDFQDAGVPLTPDQEMGLAQVLNPRNPAGRGPGMSEPDPATGLTPRDEALLTQAAQVLSPAQVAVMRANRADQNRMQAIMRPYQQSGAQIGQSTTIMMGR